MQAAQPSPEQCEVSPTPHADSPSVAFPFSARQRAQNGLYHARLEEIGHVIQDQAGQIPCSPLADEIIHHVLVCLNSYTKSREAAPYGEDTIRLCTTWYTMFLAAIRETVGVDHDEEEEEIYADFIEPWLWWVLAEAGRHFLTGGICRIPVGFPKFFEEPVVRSTVLGELEAVVDVHRSWAMEAARGCQWM
jgi:hypothetical protein